jgi:RNA polymerase sigma factor (sigma-70 family)
MSRPLAVKGGGACPSKFSTPGFPPARLATGGGRCEVTRAGRCPDCGQNCRTSQLSCLHDGAADSLRRVPRAAPPSWVRDQLLTELYRAESRRLVRILSRQTSNPDDAHDLVQDAFFRLARLREAGRMLERPHAYLRRIVSNLLKDRAKSQARHSISLHVAADEETLAGHDQQKLLESRDMLRRLEAAITRLRPRTREVFMAHRIEGLSYAEIAERTGLSVKGVEKQMSKALVQLDRLLNRS